MKHKHARVVGKQLQKSPVTDVTRKIKEFTRLLLFVRAGGYCQFDGCPKYLLEHHVTLTEGNFAQMAHIVAFSEQGPRGNIGRPGNINAVENLMALCPECHKLIDDNPELYSKETLIRYKEQHERRIRHLTGLKAELKTSILVLKSKIGDQTVAVPFDQVLEAVSPRYPQAKESFIIDLTQLPTNSVSFIGAACDAIQGGLTEFFGTSGAYKKTGHVSLFALAPIPLLVFLGSRLTNKVSLDVYQRHRDKENWTWKKGGLPVRYGFKKVQVGKRSAGVAVILSLSGRIDRATLPQEITKDYAIYEMSLVDREPSPIFLRTRADIENFKIAYQEALATVLGEHKGLKVIDIFPAVPAPIAVLCGRELLPKVHPSMRVYDNDRKSGGFTYQLTINEI